MFSLVLQPDKLRTYGDIPDVPNKSDETAETYRFLEEGDFDLLDQYFIDEVNKLTGTLLDYGDVDYLNEQRCKQLLPWLNQQLDRQDLPPRLISIYQLLKDLAERAIDLGTGVVIEL